MTVRVLLGSGGVRTPERAALLAREMRAQFGDARRILFVPYALADHDGYVAGLVERGLNSGYELDGIHRHADPVRAVGEAEGIFVGGGNTFRLVDALQRLGLIPAIRARVAAGVPYLGISAGTNVACPTMMTTNDMPILKPTSFDALGLVPFQINAHYYEGRFFLREGDEYVEHFGETRAERIEQFHEHNETPVVGLYEGTYLRRVGESLTLVGGEAVLFRKGIPAERIADGADLSYLLK